MAGVEEYHLPGAPRPRDETVAAVGQVLTDTRRQPHRRQTPLLKLVEDVGDKLGNGVACCWCSAPCGIGKSIAALALLALMQPRTAVLFAPLLLLLKQLAEKFWKMRETYQHRYRYTYLVICSKRDLLECDGADSTLPEGCICITTKPTVALAKILERGGVDGNLLIFGTHRSSKAVAELLNLMDRAADLVQVDEAHNLKRWRGAPASDDDGDECACVAFTW